MSEPEFPGVWVFLDAQARQPAAVFSTLELGEVCVRKHGFEGMLTWYPLDVSAYDWAVQTGRFKPRPAPLPRSVLAGFTSAAQPHEHFSVEEVEKL
ncbi:hypothetical protein ACFFLM_24850 [Deinococcus oregonensis]|uniref:DUF7710 domain-containing protein n=1 Tax=Deinococcus oregonensis TaxID=1805970 RepID=A0ABV6B5X3_9DEIO